MPGRETGSCLDPELPGTGLQTEGSGGPARLTPEKRVSRKPAEIGKHEEKCRTNAGRNEEGSVASRVRRLLSSIAK